MNSRQRMLQAIQGQEVDHIPCCFMSFAIMRNKHNQDRFSIALDEMEMGLDPMIFTPSASRWERSDHPDLRGLPVHFSPEVETKIWQEGDDLTGRLLKEYITPTGKLTSSVRLSSEWPHGDRFPFMDDHQIPQLEKPLITTTKDLEALDYLLIAPQESDIQKFQAEAVRTKAFTDLHKLLLAGGWGVSMDMANWLCGMENLMFLMLDQPEFVIDLLERIHQWNTRRMRVVLESGVDIYIHRGFYEGCDFVTPKFYQRAILPRLKASVDLAHEYGAKFGYICSSGIGPMLDFYLEAGIDVLLGLDPVQGTYTNLPLIKEKLREKISLWGGVSASMTIERGTKEDVRVAVQDAIQSLGPTGFILSPVYGIRLDETKTWRNIEIFIDAWKSNW